MKNYIIILLAIFVVSCSDDNGNTDQQLKINENSLMQKFTGSEVALLTKEGVKLTVKDDQLLKSFNHYSKQNSLDKIADRFEIIDFEGENYIRFFNEDGSTSTVKLQKVSNSNKRTNTASLSLGGTVCSSSKCSWCCGCMPKDDGYCSFCENDSTDCTRSSSSTSEITP
jgi:hypothetical protein